MPQAKLVTLIAAKWREFAAAAGQYKKSKLGLLSPSMEAPTPQEKVTETSTPGPAAAAKESGNFELMILHTLSFDVKLNLSETNYQR